MAIIGAATGVVSLVSGLFKKKRYVLWTWDGTQWTAVAEGTSKTVKKAAADYKAHGFTTVIQKAGVTPAPLTRSKHKSDLMLENLLPYAAIGGGAFILYFLLKKKRKR